MMATEPIEGWIIQRQLFNETRYWNGSTTEIQGFVRNEREAIVFVRECDAQTVLARIVGGPGRVKAFRLDRAEIE